MPRRVPALLNLDYDPRWDRFALVVMTVIGVIVGVAQVRGLVALPGDGAVYWLVPPGLYDGRYAYPPVLVQLLVPLRATDLWQVFVVGWTTLCCASLGYVLGRWAPLVLAIGFLPIANDAVGQFLTGTSASVFIGNVTVPMVAAMVAGMRHPGWWSVSLLTKMTTGVGLLWFAFRGEWRRFAIGVGVTAVTAIVSFVLAPLAWVAFVQYALGNLGATSFGPPIVGPPLPVRLLLGLGILGIGARLNQPRLVPVACAVSVIGLYGWATLTSIAVAAFSPRLDKRYLAPGPRSVPVPAPVSEAEAASA